MTSVATETLCLDKGCRLSILSRRRSHAKDSIAQSRSQTWNMSRICSGAILSNYIPQCNAALAKDCLDLGCMSSFRITLSLFQSKRRNKCLVACDALHDNELWRNGERRHQLEGCLRKTPSRTGSLWAYGLIWQRITSSSWTQVVYIQWILHNWLPLRKSHCDLFSMCLSLAIYKIMSLAIVHLHWQRMDHGSPLNWVSYSCGSVQFSLQLELRKGSWGSIWSYKQDTWRKRDKTLCQGERNNAGRYCPSPWQMRHLPLKNPSYINNLHGKSQKGGVFCTVPLCQTQWVNTRVTLCAFWMSSVRLNDSLPLGNMSTECDENWR